MARACAAGDARGRRHSDLGTDCPKLECRRRRRRRDPSLFERVALMELLDGQRVLAAPGMAQRPLARYFKSLGAEVIVGELAGSALASASFLIEDLGLPRLEELGLSREVIASLNPRLIHVSVTTFGSYGPHARWRGGELVTSAMGGVLRLTGEPDRPPVKEALDACLFHADMVAAAGAMAAHYS